MLPRHEHLVREIVYSVRLIQTRGAGRDAAGYEADGDLRAIVERKVEIIGDDLIRLWDEDRPLFLRIASGDALIGLRNVICYRDDDDDPTGRFWHDVLRALPDLLTSAEQLLSTRPGERVS